MCINERMGQDLELKRSGKLTNSPREYDFIFSVQRLKYRRSEKERVFIFSQLRRAVTHTRACHKWLSFDSLIYRLSSLQTDLCSHKGGEHRWVYGEKEYLCFAG